MIHCILQHIRIILNQIRCIGGRDTMKAPAACGRIRRSHVEYPDTPGLVFRHAATIARVRAIWKLRLGDALFIDAALLAADKEVSYILGGREPLMAELVGPEPALLREPAQVVARIAVGLGRLGQCQQIALLRLFSHVIPVAVRTVRPSYLAPRTCGYPTHTRALRNMRSHGPSSPQSSGRQELATARKTRSGCGIVMVKRPSGVVRPVMPCGEPLGLYG